MLENTITNIISGLNLDLNSDFVVKGMLIAVAVMGVCICLSGLKLVRFWTGLSGLISGALVAAYITGVVLAVESPINLIIVAGVAIVFAVLGAIVPRVGGGLFALTGATALLYAILQPQDFAMMIIPVVVAVVLMILLLIWFEPLFMFESSLIGGTGAVLAALHLAGLSNILYMIIGSVVFVLIGLILQFTMKSREIGKKQKVHSKTVKEEISKESEIEQARSILNLEEDDVDEN